MTLETWLIYLAAGRLLTWLLQVNGLTRPLWEAHPTLQEMRDCDLCLGVWVYFLLAVMLTGYTAKIFPSWLEKIILAAMTSLIAHLLRIGWQTKFGITVID